ncbi:MAG: hypothetical protein WA130_08005 [Candidatus Methanoperedens sp.]
MKRKELGEASVRRNYAFSHRTIENLKWLMDHRIYRNETEAIDLAIERMRTMYEISEETSKPSIPEHPEDAKTQKPKKV